MSEEESNLVKHAQYELERAGLLDDDSDYNGMLGAAVLDIVRMFSQQRHSGASASLTIAMATRLMNYEPLSALTDDPGEWFFHGAEVSGEPDGLWQNKRDGRAFSKDGGKTYTLVDSGGVVITSEPANG